MKMTDFAMEIREKYKWKIKMKVILIQHAHGKIFCKY